jgi:Zn-finger nucleic acid-binding protein
MVCPACGAAMREVKAEETYGRPLTVDACEACRGLWFDGAEHLQLSPRSTLELFRRLSAAATASPASPAEPKACPRCHSPLENGSDVQRTTRFFFSRCRKGHGRFLTFFQFLRARNFVRTLTPREVKELREHIRQINCSNCGAAVDVERGSSCTYCRTPLSMIDPGQLEATVRELEQGEARRTTIDPTLPIRLMQERLRAERAFATNDPAWVLTLMRQEPSTDLVQAGLRVLKNLFPG